MSSSRQTEIGRGSRSSRISHVDSAPSRLKQLSLVGLGIGNKFRQPTARRNSRHLKCLVALEVVISELLPVGWPLVPHHVAHLFQGGQGLGADFGNDGPPGSLWY